MDFEIGKRIKEYRLHKEMSMEDLAQKIGKNKATICRYENGNVEKLSINTLKDIAAALDVDTSMLIGCSEKLSEKRKKENYNFKIGTRIKEFRKEKGMTCEELALITGKDRSTIYRYENGDIASMPFEAFVKISEALNVDLYDLIGNSKKASPEGIIYEKLEKLSLNVEELEKVLTYAEYIKFKR